MTERPGEHSTGAGEAPTCYRHRDREAHIRCVRCDRRICPDCMIDASVGFQCPACVAEGNKGVRQARTIFGGRVTGEQGYVTKTLIAVNVVIFLAQMLFGGLVELRFWLVGGPVFYVQLGEFAGVADGEYYRLLTAAFLHGGVLHLVLNMYALFLFGPPLERAFGRTRFAVIYLVAALGGTAASYAFTEAGQPSLGASGAVFGLMGALLVVGRRLGTDPRAVLVLLAINLAFGFVVPRIDWRAHLGGLVIGALCALVLASTPVKRRVPLQVAGVGAVLLLVVALVLWRDAQLRSAGTLAQGTTSVIHIGDNPCGGVTPMCFPSRLAGGRAESGTVSATGWTAESRR